MRGYYTYIIEVDDRYLNTNEDGLIINTEISERDYMFVNRIGKVAATPILENYGDIEPGDEVIVHHNVFRTYYDIRGKLKNSSNFLEGNLFKVESELIYATRKPGGQWTCLPGFCFVEPIKDTNSWHQETEVALKGTLVIGGKETERLGLKIGDVVGFTPDSEYEFNIEGDTLYRIQTNSLNIICNEGKRTKTEDNQELSQSA